MKTQAEIQERISYLESHLPLLDKQRQIKTRLVINQLKWVLKS